MTAIAVKTCLTLGDAYRRLFHPVAPDDLHDAKFEDGYFEHEVRKSGALLDRVPSVRGKRVLEVGCAYGGLLVALGDAGADATGVDVDERRVQFARDRGLNALIGTAEDLPFGDASFDVIVSDATLEHLPDIEQALAEARRVLRPGGEFHAMWGPAWLTYNGPHLIKCLSVPWVHLIFSDRTILAALETQKAAERWPTDYIDYKIADFQNMGRLTRRNLRAAARAVGFEILEESSQSRRRSKQLVSRFPVMDELFAGSLFIALRNPT